MRNRLKTLRVTLSVFLLSCNPLLALDVVVISDLNGSYGSTRYSERVGAAISRIIELDPDLVISTGDMVAGQRKPVLSENEVLAMWRSFHAQVSDPLQKAGIPFVVTPGNHDASAYGGFEREREIFELEWKARKPRLNYLDDADFPFFYAFELGGVVFASLDATTLGPLSGGQNERIARLSEGRKPIVTFSHLPLWPFAQQREKEIIGDPLLESVYQANGVVLHLSGHHHAYFPGWKNGVAYISQACLGGGSRMLIGEQKRSEHSFTQLTFAPDSTFSVTALKAPNFLEAIENETLPSQIRSPKAVLQRLDLISP